MTRDQSYDRRVVDAELDELLPSLSAISLEGAKGVGKTATASRRANTVHALDRPAQRAVIQADPSRLVQGVEPILIDESQRMPESWDLVRRAVDEGPVPSRFLLTGSASPTNPATHSGAGRIALVRMRPLALNERTVAASVSLRQLLTGTLGPITGTTISASSTTSQRF